MTEPFILFRAGGLAFAVASSAIRSIYDDINIQAVGDTHHWFLGLAVADGELLPVSDFGAYLALKKCTGRILGINPDVGVGALKVDEVIGVDKQAQRDEHATLPSELLEHKALFNFALSSESGTHWVLDVPRLLQSEQFINIGEPA